jgi:lactoylglutathione lyase
MKIEHVALWVKDIEIEKEFFHKYFGARSNEKYINSKKGFQSYFLSFDSGARIEIMQMDSIPACSHDPIQQHTGLIHFALSLGSRQEVDKLTSRLKQDGFSVVDGPRTTGDGYYESVVLDPEGNRIELTV